MNYLVLSASVISLMAVGGHFSVGIKDFLKPVINSDIADIPKFVMKSLFHYMSVFMVLSTILLFLHAINFTPGFLDSYTITMLLGFIYGSFAIAQFVTALASPVKKGPVKMFQWIFWTLISVLSILGA